MDNRLTNEKGRRQTYLSNYCFGCSVFKSQVTWIRVVLSATDSMDYYNLISAQPYTHTCTHAHTHTHMITQHADMQSCTGVLLLSDRSYLCCCCVVLYRSFAAVLQRTESLQLL